MSQRVDKIVSQNKHKLSRLPFNSNLLTPGAGVNFYTDLKIELGCNEKATSLIGMIPGWTVSKEKGYQSDSILLLENNERAFFYNNETKEVILLGNMDDFGDGQAVGWTSYWMMEAQRQKNSLFTLHSSALAIGNNGILLLGHSGAGKTSLMLHLCENFNGKVISNDLTIIKHDVTSGQMTLIDGTKLINLRLSSIEINFPDLRKLCKPVIESTWESKISVTPEELGLKSSFEPTILRAIFKIHIDSKKQDPLIIRKEKGIPIRYYLYEDMSRIIRGSAISIFSSNHNFLGYMPSLDSEDVHDNRISCINQMVNQTEVISVSGGDINEVGDAIMQITSDN